MKAIYRRKKMTAKPGIDFLSHRLTSHPFCQVIDKSSFLEAEACYKGERSRGRAGEMASIMKVQCFPEEYPGGHAIIADGNTYK